MGGRDRSVPLHPYVDFLSPICAGSDGRPFPPYLLPLSAREKEAICFWARSCRCHDEIQIDCGALEIPAYKELAAPESVLSQKGRRICRDIEAATDIPTYYYLMRYWGRRDGEASRVCPSCGGPWKNLHAAEGSRGIDGEESAECLREERVAVEERLAAPSCAHGPHVDHSIVLDRRAPQHGLAVAGPRPSRDRGLRPGARAFRARA